MRVLSRCVLVPFREQFREQSAKQMLRASGLPTCCRKVVVQLLQMNEQDMVEIAEGTDKIHDELASVLQGYGMLESTSRIALNLALTYSFAQKVLSIPDKNELVDTDKFYQLLLKDVAKYAATWQNLASGKGKYAEPPVPMSPSKKASDSTPASNVSEMLQQTVKSLDAKELSLIMRIVSHKGLSYLAFKEDQAVSALSSHKKDISFLHNCRKNILSIPGSIYSASVKFPGTHSGVRAMFIPVSALSDQVVKLLDGTEEESGEGSLPPSASTFTTNDNAAPEDKVPAITVENVVPPTASGNANSGSDQPLNEAPAESQFQEEAANGRPRSLSLLEQRFPSPPPRCSPAVSQSQPGVTAASSSGSNQQTTSTCESFHPGIVSSTAAKEPARDCAKCGLGFDVRAKKIICHRCDNPYHRDCQSVRDSSFRGDRVSEWTCKKCKEGLATKSQKVGKNTAA